MVTAFGTIELAVEAMKLGATDFLRKPLTPETLRGALAAALSKTLGGRQLAHPRPPARRRSSTRGSLDGQRFLHSRSSPPREKLAPNEHLFEIRHALRGPQGQVTVSLDPKESQGWRKRPGAS